MIKIVLNGKNTDISEGEVLGDIVERLKLDGPVAAQVNEEIVRREDFSARELKEGDQVELFRVMGGGV